jgi:hypothetical protein
MSISSNPETRPMSDTASDSLTQDRTALLAAFARHIIAASPHATGADGKAVYFLPLCINGAQALAAISLFNGVSGLSPEPFKGFLPRMFFAFTGEIGWKVRELTAGKARVHSVRLGKDFDAWLMRRPELEYDFPGAIAEYTHEVGLAHVAAEPAGGVPVRFIPKSDG